MYKNKDKGFAKKIRRQDKMEPNLVYLLTRVVSFRSLASGRESSCVP
jgi:hypothetical protein